MATTPGGAPYPLGTDQVVDGDDAIHALATWVDPATNTATFAYGTNPAWTPGGGYLVRAGGQWVLNLSTDNVLALSFAANQAVTIGTIPAGARPGVQAFGTTWMYDGTWRPVFTSIGADGVVGVQLATPIASQAARALLVRALLTWPVKP